jgi:hypothetical protein
MSKTKGGAKYTHTPLFVVMFFISYALKHAHSARYLLGEHPREPVPVRAADAQARERVAVLDAASVAAAVAERHAGHKGDQHGQHAPEYDACIVGAPAARPLVENRNHVGDTHHEHVEQGEKHSSQTRGLLPKYEMFINNQRIYDPSDHEL